jgi:hypothetical protein
MYITVLDYNVGTVQEYDVVELRDETTLDIETIELFLVDSGYLLKDIEWMIHDEEMEKIEIEL